MTPVSLDLILEIIIIMSVGSNIQQVPFLLDMNAAKAQENHRKMSEPEAAILY
jgi:hypothetical protein